MIHFQKFFGMLVNIFRIGIKITLLTTELHVCNYNIIYRAMDYVSAVWKSIRIPYRWLTVFLSTQVNRGEKLSLKT